MLQDKTIFRLFLKKSDQTRRFKNTYICQPCEKQNPDSDEENGFLSCMFDETDNDVNDLPEPTVAVNKKSNEKSIFDTITDFLNALEKLQTREKNRSTMKALLEDSFGRTRAGILEEKLGMGDKKKWEDRKVRSNILLLGESLGGKVFQVLLDDTLPMKDKVAVLGSKLISIHQHCFGGNDMLITLFEKQKRYKNNAPSWPKIMLCQRSMYQSWENETIANLRP